MANSKNWIADATQNKGALRSKLKVKPGHNIPEEELDKAAKKPGKLGKEARLAETLRGFKK